MDEKIINAKACQLNEVISRLREKLNELKITDPTLRTFHGLPVMTHAFFPGGNGLFEGTQATRFPINGTLVLGSNFGCVEEFVDSHGQLRLQDERGNRTWRPLLQRLQGAGIRANECFFTNAWPFLHEGKSNLDPPLGVWMQNQALLALCIEFFKYTCAIFQPRLVIALGRFPAAFLSHVWPQELLLWRGCSIQHLDSLPLATVRLQNWMGICVAITHPSMPNAHRRKHPYRGNAGEIQLL